MNTSISRRHFIKQTTVSAAALPLLSCARSLQQKKTPNIIFFIADDMRPEMFNFLPQGKGKNLTPNLDRLVREGTVMKNQYVVSPVCTPSRYNCLTGKFASRSQYQMFTDDTRRFQGQTVVQWNSFITDGEETVVTHLKRAGYTTGFVGKNHVYDVKDLYEFPSYDLNARDPEIDEKLKDNTAKMQAQLKKSGFDFSSSLYVSNPNYIGLKELAVQNMDFIAKGGVDFIDQHHDKPFFLYFATTVPHGPTEDERSWKADPLNTPNGYLDEPIDVLPPRYTLPKRIKEAGITEGGKENVLWLDDALGALIRKLEEYGIDDNTLIFFFNDHGQEAKGTLYQGGIHNPSIVWKKGGFGCGARCETAVSNIDFAPTILDYASAPFSSDAFDGRSFKKSLDGKPPKHENSLYFELGFTRAVIKNNWKYLAVRYPEYSKHLSMNERRNLLEEYNDDRRFRQMMIVNEDDATLPYSHISIVPGGRHAEHESYGRKPGYFDRDQLYNLADDPDEMVNLATDPKYRNQLEIMKQELQSHLKTLPGKFNL